MNDKPGRKEAAAADDRRLLPLCVDLDGTLVATDTFAESLLLAVRTSPFRIFQILALLSRSRAACKQLVCSLAPLDARTLPYHEPLVEYLRSERANGRRLLLVTGADQAMALSVADHLGFFDGVLASDGTRNLTSHTKAAAIRDYLGGQPFAYAGDSPDDLAVWREAQRAVLAGAPRRYAAKVALMGTPVERVFPPVHGGWRALLRLLRPAQWAKNLLIFVPLFLSHKLMDQQLWGPTARAFCALSACASALYVWNDLLDVQADRAHPRKRRRPLAAGTVSIPLALVTIFGLLGLAALLTVSLPTACHTLLLLYAAGSLSYSLLLKQRILIDVLALAGLYTLRIYYGGAAAGIAISVWTTAFSLFLFLALALLKRLTELRKTAAKVDVELAGRGYTAQDLPILGSLASAASYLAALVLGLYIQSPEVQLLYRQPQYLWLMLPVTIYWLSRALLLANRGQIDDDPVLFALRDPASYWCGLACAVVAWLASA